MNVPSGLTLTFASIGPAGELFDCTAMFHVPTTSLFGFGLQPVPKIRFNSKSIDRHLMKEIIFVLLTSYFVISQAAARSNRRCALDMVIQEILESLFELRPE